MLDVVRDVGVVDGDAVIVIVFGVGDATISPAPDLSLTLHVLTFCVFRVRTITMKICLGAKNNTGRAGFTLTNKSLPATTVFYEMSHCSRYPTGRTPRPDVLNNVWLNKDASLIYSR